MTFRLVLWRAVAGFILGTLTAYTFAQTADNAIENVQVSQRGGQILIKVSTKEALAAIPPSFSVANPPRVAFDFAQVANALSQSSQVVNEGALRSFNVVEVGDRTRLVLNLQSSAAYDAKVEGNALFITLTPSRQDSVAAGAPTERFAEARDGDGPHAVRDVRFRRGKDGEGRVVVDLADSNTGIDIRQQGSNLVVDFLDSSIADELRKRLDVTDFATPVTTVDVTRNGPNVRLTIAPRGLWEHNAYQSETQFILEVKPVAEDPNKLVQGSRPGYQGEKLSLNFQNIDVRSVLQVVADFTNNNIITSDTVSGNVTLRLKDVPWDQALDIILDAKGLDKRKNGNVIWIAPRDELAAKEKLALETKQQVAELEQLHTEVFQLNYHKAEEIFKGLKEEKDRFISKRGSIVMDARSNKLIVTEIPTKLDEMRRIIQEIDVPTRQVLIEARIVEASDNFAKNLGARLGFHSDGFHRLLGNNSPRFNLGGSLTDTGFHTGQVATTPDFIRDSLSVNLPASNIAGKQPGQFSFILANSAGSQILNLEVNALEQDGKGKVVSSPKVMTSDQNEAIIEQGVEIPYQQATSSGATSISFRKANLALKVRPQITPDGRVQMALDVNKDTPNTQLATGSGVAIDTKHVKTDVLVENGGTVVIGGIYTQEDRKTQTRIPVLGELPYVGFLFRNTERVDNRTELLIFITPKILSEALTLR
jgi:type IV pilus assembly protein PilQ